MITKLYSIRSTYRQIFTCTLLAFLLSISVSVKGQSYYFRHYQVENGLSNNTVFSCLQDKQGFIWMGTKDGLDRFNGYSFDVFGSGKDLSGLEDGYIRSLYLSSDDSMYVGTRIGIFKYHPLLEKFSLVLKTNYEVTCIQKDLQGNLWFVSGNRLSKYNEASHTKVSYPKIAHPSVTCIYITPDGNLYAGTSDGFIEKWLPGADAFASYDLFENDSENSPKWIERLYGTLDNKLMVGTSNYGVKYFDPANNTHEHILTISKGNNNAYVRDFLQVSDSEVWIATEAGIFVYNTRKNTLINLRNETGNNYSLSDNAVYTLCLDKEGGIWAGTYSGGVNYYHPQYSIFTKFFPQLSVNSLSGNVVREIYPDNYGNLWIGTEDAGLNKLDLSTNTITRYLSSGSVNGLSYPNIHGLLAIGNRLLIGTFEHGLDIMDIPSGKVINHYPNSAIDTTLRSRFIVTLIQSHDSVIYAGTRMGLYTFNLRTGEFQNVNATLADCFVHSLFEDKQGNIWIGTMGSGLFMYSPKSKTIKSLSKKLEGLKSAGTQWITTIFQNTDNTLWIGTEGSGLIKYDTNKDVYESYAANYGFPGNTIYKILEDHNKFLWITTSGGLVHFNPQTKRIIKIYTTSSGLLSNQFNYSSGYEDSLGRMYFGSVKGMISFNPKEVQSSSYIPPVYITNITTEGRKIYLSENKQSLMYDPKITLKHNQSTFSIEFASLSFISPEMTKYRYRMNGLDKQWIDVSNPRVFFTSLPKGTYDFEVESAAIDGKWSGKIAHLTIEILPSFWQSRIAYILYFLAIGGFLFFILRTYHMVTTEKNKRLMEHTAYEKEKEMYHNKLNFLTNVAHEIRTPLTLIKAPLEKIIKQADSLPNIRKYLFTMQKNTDRMIGLSEELLDFRKTEVTGYGIQLIPADLNVLVKEVLENFEETAFAKRIKMNMLLSPQPLIANIDKEAITKILTNLLANAVKYASQNIIITSSYSKSTSSIIVKLKNDGERISAEMSEKIFEPFYRLEAARGKSGSGLGLTIARSLAILHSGSLVFTDEEENYNTFVLTLPATTTTNPIF